MFRLAAFADEISQDAREQAEQCARLGVQGIELRSVGGTNVLDLSDEACRDLKRLWADHGLRVICIGSPIGKVPVDQPWAPHLERFRVALRRAIEFEAGLIRIFSFYPGAGGVLVPSEVSDRLATMAALAATSGVTLVHENEREIHGEKALACRGLLDAVASPHMQAAFDPANFVQAGENAWAAWELLRDRVIHIHIKDARRGSGEVVPAGQGDGAVAAMLRDAAARGYDGYLSLEPHLAAAGRFSGFSGVRLFEVAVRALRDVLREQHLAAS